MPYVDRERAQALSKLRGAMLMADGAPVECARGFGPVVTMRDGSLTELQIAGHRSWAFPNGKVVCLVQRGDDSGRSFGDVVQDFKSKGASGVLFVDNVPSETPLRPAGLVDIPVVGVPNQFVEALESARICQFRRRSSSRPLRSSLRSGATPTTKAHAILPPQLDFGERF